jgi:L-methionine (R)-S-oxide reductase
MIGHSSIGAGFCARGPSPDGPLTGSDCRDAFGRAILVAMTTPYESVEQKMSAILKGSDPREHKAAAICDVVRSFGPYRWTGIYDVDERSGVVSNIAWSGPSAPEFPVFPVTKGLTSRAIAAKRTVNVGEVAQDQDYLTALASTQSEIILPVLSLSGDRVVGTLDVESETPNAFDSDAAGQLERCALLLAKLWDQL